MKFTVAVCMLLALFAARFGDAAPTRQELAPREGYVPVYVRVGDESLSEINPDLAAAFNEDPVPVAPLSVLGASDSSEEEHETTAGTESSSDTDESTDAPSHEVTGTVSDESKEAAVIGQLADSVDEVAEIEEDIVQESSTPDDALLVRERREVTPEVAAVGAPEVAAEPAAAAAGGAAHEAGAAGAAEGAGSPAGAGVPVIQISPPKTDKSSESGESSSSSEEKKS